MRKISLDKIQLLFAKIAENAKLYLPIDNKDGSASYGEWQEGVEMSRALNTTKSPKDFFFPQSEDLMRFKTEGKRIDVIDVREEVAPFVVFGVRACDVKSFDILDRVFLTEPRDSFYAMKREAGVIISLACNKPSETCFCTAFGINAAEPAGDISAWECGTDLYLKANTERGEKLLASLSDILEDGCECEVEKTKAAITKIMDKLPLGSLTTDGFGGGKTMELFDDPAWDELSATCLGCGTCTFVCPTCQCYDIKDFNTGNGVIRYRCWDSCMYSEFTKMAHGNNRLTQKERFRQRFMHKLVYYPENNEGIFGCVGCGRCLARCPISMNIVKVMKKIGGKKGE